MNDKIYKTILFLVAAIIPLVCGGIIYALVTDAYEAFEHFGFFRFLTSKEWSYTEGAEQYGALPFITGTLMTTLLALIFCIPFSLPVALFVGEYFKGTKVATILSAVNLMHNLYPNIRVDGEILLNGDDILTMEPIDVRRRVGMVFQRPAPFPTMSIYDNVLSGFTLNGIRLSKEEKDSTVERCLKNVALWDEVKDVLNKKGTFLSGGQQQRLCIARALAMQPDILLMDEPTSALDPIVTKHIEELLLELQKEVTILIVTHNMGQAKRISSKSMFMYLGELVEYGDTEVMFSNPNDERTKAYLTGKMG